MTDASAGRTGLDRSRLPLSIASARPNHVTDGESEPGRTASLPPLFRRDDGT
jgi:hypothetical protein